MKRIFLATYFLLATILASAQDTTRLSLIFLGDIMQHDSQIADAYDPVSRTYNYKPCFQYIKPYLESVDLAVGNLELTLAGPPYKGYPQFGAPDELLVALKNMGMDVLVTANNHCVDRGKKGLERTIHMLDSFNILHTGTFTDEVEQLNLHPLLIEKKGFRLALLNYTYGTNGLPVTSPNIVSMIDKEQTIKDLKRAKEMLPDAIIVVVHWGSEYQSLPNAWQKEMGKFYFDQGVDIVIGAHPHVLQPMEWDKKKDKFIAYSLGNFVSGQRKRYTDGGALVRLELEKVKVNDSTSDTRLDTAGYILEWVYRDAEKNYYILPLPTAELAGADVIKSAESRNAFKVFADDSRALFKRYNVNVGELNSAPSYMLQVPASASDTLQIRQYLESNSKIEMINDQLAPRIQIGPFTKPDALHIIERMPYKADTLRIKE